MEYYIALDPTKDSEFISIGTDNQFGVFWSDTGLDYLYDIFNNHEELVDEIVIKDEKGKTYSILQFLDKLKGLKLR